MDQLIRFIITTVFDQKTIREFLESFHLSKSNIYKLERDQKVLVNQQIHRFSHQLSVGDELIIELEKYRNEMIESKGAPFEIVYEDEDIVIVNKKAFLLVYSDGNSDENLTDQVNYYFQKKNYPYKVLPVHRIDYETSGMVIFAKHLLSLSYMSYIFENHQIKKQYICLSENHFSKNKGLIRAKIGSDRHQNKQIITKTGKEATSFYQVIKEEDFYSRVKVEIKGGRKHQIRVHLSSIGHPIVGDQLYGGRKNSRLMLHFTEVSFIHPRSQIEQTFTCPEPF